ncbi:type VI secretion system tip protein TssI/VgrG [Sorangium sp. So ce315]|uniref:type VI secretion system Vgr family protein n=1 Tax=Sorangium sp. So ce315 TaxID=3133299 RepID=UPI003F60A2C9
MSDAISLHQAFFATEGLPPELARVRSIVAHEGLSFSYQVEVELDLSAPDVDPGGWIGANATAMIAAGEGGVPRLFCGLVTRVRERASRSEAHRIAVTLESPLAVLRWTTDYRIFQEQTTQEIVTVLLEERGLDASRCRWRLSGSYPKREVCTQFGEDTFTFVSRILEEDGIFYFHEHGDDGAIVVFGDSGAAYTKAQPSAEVPFRPESGLTSGYAITALALFERARPAKVTLRDHDFKRPALDLEATASGKAPLGREHYDYPGRYVDPAEGARRARIRLEALEAASQGARGAGTVTSLAPGHAVTLTDVPEQALEGEWVVREIEHVWEDAPAAGASLGAGSYRNRFHLLPKDLPFRPPASAPECDVPGPQLAIVTGPAGEEIHTDAFGRVKVQFPWDRRGNGDEKSSCWVRVAQMHSSGSVAIPRVGWEVVVDFEGGDPDRPIVLGRVYNGKYGPPYKLPDSKTQSALQSSSSPGGGGHNEIRMEDGGGNEHVHVHAEKDLNVVVANNKTEKVANVATLGVGSNHKQTVGANATLDVGAQEDIEIGGSQTISVGASRTETVSSDEKVDIKGSRSLTIGGSHTTMTPMSVSASTPASFSETVGGSAVEAAALGVGMAVAGVASITVGGAEIAACATGASSFTLGAHATTVGGAFISASGKDVAINVGGAKATTVGGVWAAQAGGDIAISSGSTLNITVGGALSMNAASIALKVGGSNVTISAGSVVIKSSTIKLTATGPQPELAPMVADK